MNASKFSATINHVMKNDKVYYEVIVSNQTDTKVSVHRYSELKDFHD